MFWRTISLLSRFIHVMLGVGTPQNFPPPLSKDEEQDCFERMQRGDMAAREKLILHNLRLVAHIVRKYYGNGNMQEDLVSIGTIGLVKAVDSFDPTNGARFATYSAKCIQNEILMFFRFQKKLCAEISINETIDVDRDGNPLTYSDIFCSDENIGDETERKMKIQRMLELVEKVLAERERLIIVMRYGLYGKRAMTQREIARAMGISRSYVSRIEKSALEKLYEGMGR